MWTYFCSALTAKVLPPQFRCRFILYIFTQFRAVLHKGLALQRDEASLFASKKSKPSNSHLVKFKRFLHVSECNLASTWKIAEQYIQSHWRSVPMVIDNNYTLSVYCCVDIIISLNGYWWMDELGFYVPSTVFQSFRDDERVNMKGSVQWSAV